MPTRTAPNMHLREVHMENFKTFKGKYAVPFEPGFTGITGPNGSGKSNIGDAIMFVLGPNSPRAMRAKNLTDLIYNGGQGGKPSDHCVVSLVFDNADRTMPVDADTVTLTRRVRRDPSKESPEGSVSYFYVNGRASQKKEFIDLLDHARISADGYNITLQGDVQHICNMTAVDRRRILDDIAGVTTFDRDIAVADARKGDVAANLERIGVVLAEIDARLQQLDKDRSGAQRHRELQEAIKALKGMAAWRKREDLQAQVARVRQEAERFTAQRAKEQEALQALKGRQAEATARLAEAEKRIREEGGEEAQKLQEKVTLAHGEMTRLEEKINFAKAELATAREALAPLTEELRRIEKALASEAKMRDACAAEHAKATADLDARRKELEALRTAISSSDKGAMRINQEMSALKQEHEAKQLELHEAKLEADRTAEKLKAAEKALADTTLQADALAKDLEETTWQLKELRANAGGAGKKTKEQEKRLFELRKSHGDLMKQAEDLEQRIRRLDRERIDLQANEDAAARAQGGYGRAVQDVLQARDKREIKGIIGTVAELAKVDKKYTEAMQIAASGRLTAIVVEDDAVAAQCIDLVKRRQSGRATFLPLNKMVPGRPSGQALMKVKEQGSLGFAIDLIEFNQRYQNAFWHVFQDTLVADTMVNGRRMMGGVRIVTLDGELFEKSGAMTGGKQAKGKGDEVAFTNSDRGRLDDIAGEIAKAEAAQADAIARATKAREEADALQAELAAKGAEGASQEDRLKELERKEVVLSGRSHALASDLKGFTKETKELEAAATRLAGTIDALTTRLAEMETLRVEKGKLLLKGTGKEQRERVEALERAVQGLAEAVLKADNRRALATSQLALVETQKAKVGAELSEKEAAVERFAADAKKHTEAYAKAKAEVEALARMQRKATGAVKGLQEARDKAYNELVDLKGKIDKVADRAETLFGMASNATSKLPALEEALGDALVDLKESPYEPKAGEEVPPMEDLKRDLRSRESSLANLGPVNMRALEDYDAEAARAKELRDEVRRLESQREELVAVVAEITKKKTAAITEVFTAINENFAAVYGLLSAGGQAYMEFEDDADPFQGGLILKAQPMGKKVTRLDALSGGEKSLTSMAFIFALQRYDPSPFYYFDEVDQNLDAVNSELLAKMIKDNARFAQFIVVSLRKITLKEASHIYGVTQQTAGQSEIIAHFDIDTLRDEESEKDPSGKGGATLGKDGGLPPPPPNAVTAARKAGKKEKPKPAQETTITQLIERAVSVEVKK
ncbi:MAG TPA: chromosome segregation protein SMC [Candidatus Thermoplasmatota archaeon]|nr:chromosome segregation protein SMC [Candidatus Thermoplasmatota archaeon]